MNKSECFLADFEAVAHGFGPHFEVNIEMSIGRVRGIAYQEMLVRVYEPNYIGQPDKTVVLVKGKDKAEALTNLTQAMLKEMTSRTTSERLIGKASTAAKMVTMLNEPGLFDAKEKSAWVLKIGTMPTVQLSLECNKLEQEVLRRRAPQFTVVAEVIPVKPNEPKQATAA